VIPSSSRAPLTAHWKGSGAPDGLASKGRCKFSPTEVCNLPPATKDCELCSVRIRLFLQHHGCTVEPISQLEVRLIYPAGSTRQELYLRTFEGRYRVLLPDGIELREVDPRGRVSNVPMVSVIIDARSEPELEYYLAYVEQNKGERKSGNGLPDGG
jgi:hypothetical protein